MDPAGQLRVGLLAALWIASAGCGPAVLWQGHTPDRRTSVRVLEKDGGRSFIFGDQSGPPFDGIAFDGLVFSPGGRRVAYPARRGQDWTVVVDGEPGAWWDGIGEMVFSHDGERLAYAALEGMSWRVVEVREAGTPATSEKVGPPFDAILAGTLLFDPGNGRLAYVGLRADSVRVVYGSRIGSPFEGVAALRVVPGGGEVAYLARRGDRQFVVIGDDPGRGWDAVAGLVVDPLRGEPAFFARERGAWFAFVAGERHGPYEAADGLVFAESEPAWAFMAREAGVDRIVTSGGEGPGHPRIEPGSLRIDAGGRRTAYIVASDSMEWAVVGFEAETPFREVRTLSFTADGTRYGYVGSDATGDRVLVNGEPGPVYERVSDLIFSADGSTFAYLAWDSLGGVVVVNGLQTRFPVVAQGSLVLNSSGDHWAVIAGTRTRRPLHFYVDGIDTGTGFDWREWLDAQRLRSDGSLDVSYGERVLRSWVEAEMARWLEREREISSRIGNL